MAASMATEEAGDGDDTQRRDTTRTGLTGEQIALILNEVTGLKKVLAKRDDEFVEMMAKATRERQHTFVRPGNQSQYDFTKAVLGQVQEALRGVKRGDLAESAPVVCALEQAAEMLVRRMRLIRIADRSEYGWAVVAEYETDELALDSDDEKKISRAEKEAERKWLKKRKRQTDEGTRGPPKEAAPHIASSSDAGRSASLKAAAGPCYGCGEWGHLKRSCPRQVRSGLLSVPAVVERS